MTPDCSTWCCSGDFCPQTEGLLDRKLIELVRLGVAQINRCPSCLKGRYQDSFDQDLSELALRSVQVR